MTRPIVSRAFARAGLLGNPSDGYHGKAIGLSVRNFQATVQLRESEQLEIKPSSGDLHYRFRSLEDFVAHIDNFGYYGGIRLIKAAIKRFHRWNMGRNSLHEKNFSVEYQTTIPRTNTMTQYRWLALFSLLGGVQCHRDSHPAFAAAFL